MSKYKTGVVRVPDKSKVLGFHRQLQEFVGRDSVSTGRSIEVAIISCQQILEDKEVSKETVKRITDGVETKLTSRY